MSKNWLTSALGSVLPMMLVVFGCSDVSGPASQLSEGTLSSTAASIVSQDLAQLSVAGVTNDATKGVFSIGWKKFIGPNVSDAGTIGEAFAVAYSDTASTTTRPTGIDIGMVTLSYAGGSNELIKRTARDGRVLYETFSKGMRDSLAARVNIPFVAGSVYTFSVTGSSAFPAGTFQITAPTSLLSMTGHSKGDTVSKNADLNIQWNGGSASDSVLLRIVPHLRPSQIAGWDSACTRTGKGEKGGPKGHRKGPFAIGGPLEGTGPAFDRGINLMIPNTGSYTFSATDLQTLLAGTDTAEIMIGVTQVIKKSVVHDGGAVTVILRNGDRLVLHVK
jgi:hypothetical protein